MAPEVRGEADTINRCSSPPCTQAGAGPDRRRAETELRKLASVKGPFVRYTPDLSLLRVRVDKSGTHDLAYTLVHNKALSNVAFMLFEKDRREPADDTMTIVPGVLGSYPNFFFDVKLADMDDFVLALSAVASEDDFTKVAERFGARRSSPRFWETADWHNAEAASREPVEAGLLDLNRYEDY